MGSAQSARRIQPGGASGRAGGSRRIFPAPRSSRPLHPSVPAPRVSAAAAAVPLSPEGGCRRSGGRGGGRSGGAGGGVGGGPPPGRRPAAAGRISTVGGAPRPAPGRPGRPGSGKVARGGPPVSGGSASPGCYSPPAAALAESRGRGSPRTRRRALPPAGAPPPRGFPREGAPPAGARRCLPSGGAGPPLPRRDRSPVPAPLSPRGGPGAGRTVPSAPRASSRRRARGVSLRGRPREKRSARGRRRCRPPTRPVLKHGPRSLTRARVRGSRESRRGAMKVKGPVPGASGSSPGRPGVSRARRRRRRPPPPRPARGGIPRPLQSAEGAPPARLARRAGEVEHERTRQDPKDGELCLGRAKPEETLVEVRSGPDVQIGRPTWV